MKGILSVVVENFIRYAKIDTQSSEDSSSTPSTDNQFTLARLLAKELKALGLQDVTLDENCYVMATLPANTNNPVPTIGWIAHLDTSPEISGTNVNPRIIENYDGKDIVLDREQQIILSPKEFPEISNYVGQTIITTDGTTLLGADDKAGIAIIMTVINHLVSHPDIKHGKLRIGFTPDEEIGRSSQHFDVKKFNADFAYTIDGGQVGAVEYETFNAANAIVVVNGKNVHPGEAKNKMINAMLIANELVGLFPANERPEYTSGYEGYYHLEKFSGSVEKVKMKYLIRDFDRDKFEKRKTLMVKAVELLNEKFGSGTLLLDMQDIYFNMKECILPVMHIIDTAVKATQEIGVSPQLVPVRGGTDGARLSFMGLPTPNIFTGGHNFHSRYEYIPVISMLKAVEVIIKIVEFYSSGEVNNLKG